MTRLPALGPRGEGWVAIQIMIFVWIGGGGLWLPGSVSGAALVVAVVVGFALIAAGGLLAVSASLALQGQDALTAVPRPRDEARLVEGGVYGLVRHPIYGGLILGGLGWSLARSSVVAFLGSVALLVFFDLKRRREEAWLEEGFAGYSAYKARTRRLIPWLY
ncbi:MAG: isoprenylcysteine carboxylmethyltransferase family protein [Chloroflexi bacterium]|nr:isoprenylcysteine carboxylmethyltransferase family protein [Chloroflexota bacterium]